MAFDAGLLSFVIKEINDCLSGGKVEKIYQITADELVFLIRSQKETKRLLVNAGSICPRISLTNRKFDNPETAPMLCMLFRKHLSGAVFKGAELIGFDRVARLNFEAYDEMGFKCIKSVVYELMGTYSNVILLDGDDRIIGAVRLVEFSEKNSRVILPGIKYECLEPQQKKNPLMITREELLRDLEGQNTGRTDRYVLNNFQGMSPLISREIDALSCGDTERFADAFFSVVDRIKCGKGIPSVVFLDSKQVEYSYVPVLQYGANSECRTFDTFGEMLDFWFESKTSEEQLHHKAKDVINFLGNASKRIERKLALQREELNDCSLAENYKKFGDLIIGNIYLIKKKESLVSLFDYETGEYVEVQLDPKMSPSQNAQKYYKKYTKLKNAKIHLEEQISDGEKELAYIASVKDALDRSSSEKDVTEIRRELALAGYSGRLKSKVQKKQQKPSYLEYKTSGGFTVYCGKNNIANDYLTFTKADKNDWWFHVKNMPGSHVIMVCGGAEPDENDFTECCMIAALHSSAAQSDSCEVDYTKVRSVKKPPNSKPGYVIYHTNWSATVKTDREKVQQLQKN